ncbi:hypothetical protein DICVIV_09338 [Dictyocaulus viviparus]|uniref:Uncharacterized protein n=1 Tax=Dictyocaulus viviparus TaxID=29172 RepID=A0A0D8XLI1_DICVI|nr:hypothetical protein DICVIV_09338 [Dictyocaulus viviparus]
MSNEPSTDPDGQRMESEGANICYNEQNLSGTSREVMGNTSFSQYMEADDNEWVEQLSREYVDTYQFHDLRGIEQQTNRTEEVYLLTDQERDIETMRNSVENLQVAAHEVVVDGEQQTNVEPQQYIATVHQQVTSYPQLYKRASSEHATRAVTSEAVGPPTDTTRARYVVQSTASVLESRPNQPVQYDVRPTAMFEGPSNQSVSSPHPVSIFRSRSKSQPRRSFYAELEDDSLAYLVQEYDEGEWDGVELEDHEYFVGGPDERQAIIHGEEPTGRSYLPPHKTLHRREYMTSRDFYASAGGGHGRAPIIKRGPRPIQKPPPDYAEQQKVYFKGIPRGFQPLRSSTTPQISSVPSNPGSHTAIPTYSSSSATRLKSSYCDSSVGQPIMIPHDIGLSRIEANEHNKRVTMKQLVNDAFVNREQVNLQLGETSSNARSSVCRIPAGPSKTLRHQRSTASKAIRMIANRTIEPAIDPVSGRYVISLDDLRNQQSASSERLRYVQRPLHSLREMANSARRGGSSNWMGDTSSQGSRVSRIDQAPRFSVRSTPVTPSPQKQHSPFDTFSAKVTLVKNTPISVMRKPSVTVKHAAAAATPPLNRSDHVYPRSQSSRRNTISALNYRRSASSGRLQTGKIGLHSMPNNENRSNLSMHDIKNLSAAQFPASTSKTGLADEVLTNVSQIEKPSSSSVCKINSNPSDQNTAPNVQVRLGTGVENSEKPQKRIVLLRDAHGQLRRVTKLPDGTLLLRERPPVSLISQLGQTPTETSINTEPQRPRSPKAGTVWDVQSIVGKQGKRATQPTGPWKHSHPFAASSNDSSAFSENISDESRSSRVSKLFASRPRMKPKSRKKDALVLGDNNEMTDVVRPQKRSAKNLSFNQNCNETSGRFKARDPKHVYRLTVVSRTTFQKHGERRANSQEDEDNGVVDVVALDDILEGAMRTLNATSPPLELPDTKERKAGRPPKKFRGRLAKQKQAIRDAVLAEKVAIKHRQLPVLDLTLKVIEDPTVELPLEAPIVVNSSVVHDTALLHEVGETLKELVAQVSLEQLQPKRDIKSRSRRCWEHLPERGRSKRQEYRTLNIPVAERSPPPPPLRSKPRGRNSEKYRQAALERAKQLSGCVTASDIDGIEPIPLLRKSSCKSYDNLKEAETKEVEDVHPENLELLPSQPPASQRLATNTSEDDLTMSNFEDFDLNEDDLVDINVDTFFTTAENLDTSSGDEGDTPQKMRQKLQKFLDNAVHSLRVPPFITDSAHYDVDLCDYSRHGIVVDAVCQDLQPTSCDDVAHVVKDILENIVDGVAMCSYPTPYNYEIVVGPSINEKQPCHYQESTSSISVGLSLDRNQLSEISVRTLLSMSSASVTKTCVPHDVGVFGTPSGILSSNLKRKDVGASLVNITYPSSSQNTYLESPSEDVTIIRSKDSHYCKASHDNVSFEAVRGEEHFFSSEVVNVAEEGAEYLSIAPEVCLNLAQTEIFCNRDEQEGFEVQESAVYSFSKEKWEHSAHTIDSFFIHNAEHLEVSCSVPCSNEELDLLNITNSDLSLCPPNHDAFKDFASSSDKHEEFVRKNLSTIETIPIAAEEYCSFSDISMTSTIENKPVARNVCISFSIIYYEHVVVALSVIQVDCFLAFTNEEHQIDFNYIRNPDFCTVCKKIAGWKPVANEVFLTVSVVPTKDNDCQTCCVFQRNFDLIKFDVVASKDKIIETSVYDNITISRENFDEEPVIPSLLMLEKSQNKKAVNISHSFGLFDKLRNEENIVHSLPKTKKRRHEGFYSQEQEIPQFVDGLVTEGSLTLKSSVSASAIQNTGAITRSKFRQLKVGREERVVEFELKTTNSDLNHLWRRTLCSINEGRFGALVKIYSSFREADFPRSFSKKVKSIFPCRRGGHIIADFSLTVMHRSPMVTFDPDISVLVSSVNPLSSLRLSLPRLEGSLNSAFTQYEAGVKCILEQVTCAKSIIEKVRSTSHWSLHFVMDAQLYMLDIQYELWEFMARYVQLGLFNLCQCSLWESHHQLLNARMHSVLFKMNAAAALSSQVEVCTSYIRRFEEWNRKTKNFSSIYNHAYGLALSLIRLITIPNALKRLQSMTHWNSEERPSNTNEELFHLDLVPFFEVGTCPFFNAEYDMEKVLIDSQSVECGSLDYLFIFAQSNPGSTVGKTSLNYSYFLVGIGLNAVFDDLKGSVDKMSQVEFDYPCGQVVFDFDKGKVSVSISRLTLERSEFVDPQLVEQGHRIMGEALRNTIFDPSNNIETKDDSDTVKSSHIGKSFDMVKEWVMTIPSAFDDDVQCGFANTGLVEPTEMLYPSSPARVTVIEDDDDRSDGSVVVAKQCCNINTVTTTIAGRRIEYSVDCAEGLLKMKTMDSTGVDALTDNLSATNTITTASFNSFDQIETLKIIRSHEVCGLLLYYVFEQSVRSFFKTGEFNWIAMIENALGGAPPPEIMPTFLRLNDSSDYRTIDMLDAHDHMNHLIRETDEDGEFIDLRKEQRERIRQFQHVDYFERKRNARFEAINSGTPLEIPIPKAGEHDKIPLYALWISEVVRYAEIERKRMTQLKPINNIGRCRAVRSEMIREFSVPCKRRKRSYSTFSWFGRTVHEHFGDDLSLGMARLEYEISGQKTRKEVKLSSQDDTITHYFVSRNNSPSTMVDALELLENPYSFFHQKPLRKKGCCPPLVESSLTKKVCLSDSPMLAPFVLVDEPETLYPPYFSDYDSSDDEL